MREAIFPILIIFGGLAVGAARHVVTPLSVPTAPVTNRVAVPAANDPSSPSDGAAEKNTTAASDEALNPAAVVSCESQSNTNLSQVSTTPVHEPTIAEQMRDRCYEVTGLSRTLDPDLCRAAQDYADLLARTHQQGHYADGDPEYRAKRAGFTGSLRQPGKRLANGETSYGIGEVLAFGHRDIASAFDGWMHSPGHRSAVMEQTFDVVGCGRSGTVWCMMLGNSKVAAAAPPVAQSAQPITQFQTCRPGMPCYQPQQQYQRRGWFGRRYKPKDRK